METHSEAVDSLSPVNGGVRAIEPPARTELERPAQPTTREDLSLAVAPTTVRVPSGWTLVEQAQLKAAMERRMETRAASENWAEQYASRKAADLAAERDQLESAIYAETKEYLESRFTAGEYDLLDDADPVLKAANNNPYLISWLRFEPGQTHVKRVVLPEAEFAEFYRLRELSTWLSRTSRDRDREASDKD